jgi:hypothetical protein
MAQAEARSSDNITIVGVLLNWFPESSNLIMEDFTISIISLIHTMLGKIEK